MRQASVVVLGGGLAGLTGALAIQKVQAKKFMRSKAMENVFAAGDCVVGLSHKLGFNAIYGASVAGGNIAREVLGKKPLCKLKPKFVY